MIEYGFTVTLIGVAIIAAVEVLGRSLGGLFDGAEGKVTPKIPG